MITRLIYLLLFIAPQVLIYLYLRERLPDPERPTQARRVRTVLAGLFMLFNLPWLYVGQRLLFGGSLWGVGRIPFTGPWIAWQLMGWIYCALITLYLVGKGLWWLGEKLRVLGTWFAPVRTGSPSRNGSNHAPRTTPLFLAAGFLRARPTRTPPPAPPCPRTASGAPTVSRR